MEAFLIYTGKVAVLLAAFYLFYKWLLSRETFHRLNRWIVIGTLLLAALLPVCVVTLHRTVEVPAGTAEFHQTAQAETTQAARYTADAAGAPSASADAIPSHTATARWLTWIFALYIAGIAVTLARTALSAIRVHRLVSQGERHYDADGTPVIVTERDLSPFSWMRWIVLSRSDYEEANPFVMAHEKAHLHLGHSREVLLAELFCCLQWFNPAAWLLKRELRAIHEYEADDAVLRRGADVKAYQYSLIKKAVGMSGYSITNSFHHSTLKNRITMMSKAKSPMLRGLRVLYVLPLVACFLVATAQTVTDYKSSEKISIIGMAVPHSTAPIEKRTEPVFFKMTRGDAVADTLFLFVRPFAPEEIDGLQGSGPIFINDLPKVLEGNYHLVSLDAEPDCPMGLVEDVKKMLRDAGRQRIRYACPSLEPDMSYRLLPPTREHAQKQGSATPNQVASSKQAPIQLQVNRRGQVRQDGKETTRERLLADLTELLRDRMPDYRLVLQTERATEFGAYLAAQNAITGCIATLRDEYTQSHFGKPYDPDRFGYPGGLTEEELVATQKAIPLKVSESE